MDLCESTSLKQNQNLDSQKPSPASLGFTSKNVATDKIHKLKIGDLVCFYVKNYQNNADSPGENKLGVLTQISSSTCYVLFEDKSIPVNTDDIFIPYIQE